MKRLLSELVAVLLVALLAGCASSGGERWRGQPPAEPPEKLADWRVVWNDRQRQWQRHGSGEPIGHAEVPTQAWVAEQSALALRIEAGPRLNYGEGSAHTAALFFLQTDKPGKLEARFESSASAYQLLRRGADDPLVLAFERHIVEPGRESVVTLSRAKRGRFLVVVVAALDYDSRSATRVIPIPQVYDVPRGAERFMLGNILSTLNPFAERPDPRPGRIWGWLRLDAGGIDSLEMVAK